MMTWVRRVRRKLTDPDGHAAQLAAMNITADEKEWWRAARWRHGFLHSLRFAVPWTVATLAGSLLRVHREGHNFVWLLVVGDFLIGCLMGLAMWSSQRPTIQLRALRRRRIRRELAAELGLASWEADRIAASPSGGDP